MDKAELKRYRTLAREAQDLERRVIKLRAQASSCTRPDGYARRRKSTKDRTAELVARIVDMDARLQDKRIALLEQMAAIERAIESLEPIERLLIRLRYIDGLRWEEIAVDLNYSIQHVWRLHGEVLKKMRDYESRNVIK